MYKLSAIFILIFIFVLKTQADSLDSLKIEYQNASGTKKIDALYTLINNLRHDHAKEALTYQDEGLKLANELNYLKGKARLLSLFGYCHINVGNLVEALNYTKQSLKLAIELNDDEIKAESQNIIGIGYYFIGSYDLSLENLLKAYNTRKKLNNIGNLANTSNNIGLVYSKLGDYKKALEYFLISAELKEKVNDQLGLARTFTNISDINLKLNNIEISKNYLKKAEEISRRLKYNGGLSIVFYLEAKIFEKEGESNKALQSFNKARDIYILKNDKNGELQIINSIAELFIGQFKLVEAEKLLKEAITINELVESKDRLINTYKLLAELFEKKNDLSKSIYYYKKFIDIKDTVYNSNRSKQIAELRLNQEFEAKENEIMLLKKENTIKELAYYKQNYLSNIYLITLLVLIIIIFAFYYRYKFLTKNKFILENMNKEINIQKEKLQELNKTKDTVFRIIAHDLRNPFNILIGFTDTLIASWNDLDNEEKMGLIKDLNKVSKNSFILLENLLQWSLAQTNSIEINATKNVLYDIISETVALNQKLANDKNLNIINNVEKDIIVFTDSNLLKAIIRNLLSNAMKFAKEGGNITFYTETENDFIVLFVKDDGVGMSKELIEKKLLSNNFETSSGTFNEKGTGLGLVLCKEFVEKNGGKLNIESELERGTIVSFSIPKGTNN